MATNRKRSLHESYKVFSNCNSSAMAVSEVQDTVSNENPSICPPFARIEQRGTETIHHPLELNLGNKKKKKRRKTQKLSEEGCLTSTNDMSIMSAPSLSDGRNSGGKVVSLGTDETSSFFPTNSSHLLHNNSNNLSNGNSYLMTKSEVQDTVLGVGSTLCPSLARTEQTSMETSQNLVQVDVASRKKRSRKSRKKKKAKALQNSGQGPKFPEQGCITSGNHTDIVSTPSLSDERNSEKEVVSLGTNETTSFSQCLSHGNATSSSVAQSEGQGTTLGVDIMLCPSLDRIEQSGMERAQNPVEGNVLSTKKSRRNWKKKPKALQISGQAEKIPEEGCVTKIINAMSTQSHHTKIMSAPCPLDARTENFISLGSDATNSFPRTNSSPSLSHENREVFMNANPFSTSKSEVKDIILGVHSTVCPSISRIEEAGKETTQNSMHVSPASKKKKRRSRKKKSDTPQNSIEARMLPEESCPSTRSDTNIISTPTPSEERNSEGKGGSLGASENISFPLTNFSPSLSHENSKVFSDANSFPVTKSLKKYIPLGPDSTNSFLVTDSLCSLSHENQKVFSTANPSSMTNNEVQHIILGVDSTICPSSDRTELLGKETTQNYVHVNAANKKKKRRSRKKISDAIKNCGEAQRLPVESYPGIRNDMSIISTQTPSEEKLSEEKGRSLGASENNSFPLTNISPSLSQEISKVFSDANLFPMTKSEMQNGTLGVVSSICPAFAKIEGTGMETTGNSVEVNMVTKRRKRRSQNKKPNNTLDNSGEVQNLIEEGSQIRTDCMNTMSTDSMLNEKYSEERGISSGVNENKHLSHAVAVEENNCSEISHIPLLRAPIGHLKKKLLILDINGLLADIVRPPPKKCKSDINIAGRAIFKRPFCHDFLTFCFERFEVGVWSSRSKKNVEKVIDYLMGDMKHKLLLCWDQSHCTATKYKTLEDRHKPIVFKELRRIWEKHDRNLPWQKGDYNESNTLLLDDSPYKALLNPRHTAIFPYSYTFRKKGDKSLGAGGDLRVYLGGLAVAENTRKYVENNKFGQSAITQRSKSWDFYQTVIRSVESLPTTR